MLARSELLKPLVELKAGTAQGVKAAGSGENIKSGFQCF